MSDSNLKDPLNREIVLHDRTWFGHIIKGHPEMEEQREWVEKTIQNPEEIRFSNSDKDCRLYYNKKEKYFMMVIADIVLGLIKTAHKAKKKTGGKIEWLSQTELKE